MARTIPPFFKQRRSRFRAAGFFAVILSACAMGQNARDGDDQNAFAEQVREIRASARTPEELVARTEELLRSRPVQLRTLEGQDLFPQRRPVTDESQLSEREGILVDAREVVDDVRRDAKSPEEEVALVDGFLRINAETLAPLRQPPRSKAEKAAAEQARKKTLESRVSKDPDDLLAQATLILWEVREEARNPEESVALTDEFLRLNRETLQTERKKVFSDQFLNQMQR